MIGIFDAIQISRNAHRINPCMLLALMCFWEDSTNTFQLPCGILMPTLFDVVAIIGLSPMIETFDPTLLTKNAFSFNVQVFRIILKTTMIKILPKYLTRNTLPSNSLALILCILSCLSANSQELHKPGNTNP